MQIPTHLKHKPVIVAEDYSHIDGRKAYQTDAQGLSLGLAQWNDRGKIDVSAKVWRHTGGKWSRQSEELPMHRVLDLAILICKSKQFIADAYRLDPLVDESQPEIDRIGLQGDAMTVALCTNNEFIEEDIKLFIDAFNKDDEMISERLHVLSRMLKEMGY